MKYLVLVFILLLYTHTLPAESKLLASIETIEVKVYKAPPVEKKKAYKKHPKKQLKKHLKKPNRTQKTNKKFVKMGILFNLIGTSSLSILSLIVFALLFGSLLSIFFLIVAGVCMFFSIIFLNIFLVYITIERRDKKKKIILKKTEQVLRAEVSYLDKDKVGLYLSLNEALTVAKIRKNVLIRSKGERSSKEWAVAKLEIKELEAEINRTELQIKELRKQNKTMKARRERN